MYCTKLHLVAFCKFANLIVTKMAFRSATEAPQLYNPEEQQNQQQQEKAAEERRQQEEDSKRAFLTQVLDQAALARLNTFKLARPDKGAAVEEMIMRMAAMGQIGPRANAGAKVTEPELIQVLEKVSEQTQKKTTVKFERRRNALDDDD